MTSLYNCRELLAGRSFQALGREAPLLPAVLVAPIRSLLMTFYWKTEEARSAEKSKEEINEIFERSTRFA